MGFNPRALTSPDQVFGFVIDPELVSIHGLLRALTCGYTALCPDVRFNPRALTSPDLVIPPVLI